MSKRLYARGALVTWAWAQRSTHTHTQTHRQCATHATRISISNYLFISLPPSLSFFSLLVLKFDFLSHKPLVTLAFRIDLPIHNCHTAWLKFYLFIIIFPHIFYCCVLSLSPLLSAATLASSFVQTDWPVAHAYCQLTLPLSLPLSLSLFRKGKVSSLKFASIDFESCIKMQFGQKATTKKKPEKEKLL